MQKPRTRRKLKTVQTLVEMILSGFAKGRVVSRKQLKINATEKLKINERSFAKALAQLNDSGILVRKNANIVLKEKGLDVEKKEGVRTFLEIDINKATQLNEAIAMKRIEADPYFKDLNEPAKSFCLREYVRIRRNYYNSEIKLFYRLLKKYGRSDPDSTNLNAVEYYLYNWSVTRVMDYLKNWKSDRVS